MSSMLPTSSVSYFSIANELILVFTTEDTQTLENIEHYQYATQLSVCSMVDMFGMHRYAVRLRSI